MFESFSQADGSITREYGGTGLGLAISRKLVELMHGKLDLDSEEGKGSSFYFTAVFARDRTIPAHADSFSQDINSQTANDRQKINNHLLVVEDDNASRFLMNKILKNRGYIVDTAVNGKEALEALKKEKYALIFMAVNMPVMDGYTCTEFIRTIEKDQGKGSHIPIIAMTANTIKGDNEKYMEAGMDDFVTKPINFNEVYSKLENQLLKE
jgi:CheY-like chemotaxis protein